MDDSLPQPTAQPQTNPLVPGMSTEDQSDSPSAQYPAPIAYKGAPNTKLWLVAAVTILLGISVLVLLRQYFFVQPAPPQQTAPSPTPTPTPVRRPSAIATQSAFLLLDASVSSLSASIENYVVDDPMLSPPVLDLPLGFSQ